MRSAGGHCESAADSTGKFLEPVLKRARKPKRGRAASEAAE